MKIILPGIPIAKSRARTVRKGISVITYDPQSDLKNSVKRQIQQQMFGNSGQLYAIIVRLTFYFPYPTTKHPWIMPCHTTKPDIDNLVKFYLDCANQILFSDDKQIVELYAIKSFSDKPHTEINIMTKKKITLHDKVKSVLNVFDPTSVQEFYEDVETLQRLVHGVDFENLENVKPEWLSSTACFLSHFSHKYSEKLNKVKKIGDISKEIETYENIEKDFV